MVEVQRGRIHSEQGDHAPTILRKKRKKKYFVKKGQHSIIAIIEMNPFDC